MRAQANAAAVAVLALFGLGVCAANICTTCETSLTLTAAEWSCLEESMNRYLGSKADPVLIPLARCQAGAVPIQSGTRGDPSIVPTPASGGAPTYRRALRLSQAQLKCLQRTIGEAKSAPGSPFSFADKCPTAPSGK